MTTETGSFPLPAGDIIKGNPVGSAGDADTDTDSVEDLFKGIYPELAGWVRRLVDDDDTAHEIASEAFARLLSRWTRAKSPQRYLYMTATSLIRDHRRKTERELRAIRSVTAARPPTR
jgi:RNA polymerase sigma-70 factor (ECF subfamily)